MVLLLIINRIKKSTQILLSVSGICFFLLQAQAYDIEKPISESEAYSIVAAQEVARELAQDAREAELLGARILETAVADLGSKKIIFNRVEAKEVESEITVRDTNPTKADFDEFAFSMVPEKESLHFTLSGTVYEGGISKLWWSVGAHRFEIYTNADFRYFVAFDDFESEAARYSVFPIIVGSRQVLTRNLEEDVRWHPVAEDFLEGQLEWFLTLSSGDAETDEAALEPIKLMLEYYLEHSDVMRIRYENGVVLQAARKAYLDANPPKVRDIIINHRPYKPETVDGGLLPR